MEENNLITNKHILLCSKLSQKDFTLEYWNQINLLVKNFCGQVILDLELINGQKILIDNNIDSSSDIYILCNIENYLNLFENFPNNQIYIIEEISTNYLEITKFYPNIKIINLGMVPINVFNSGVFFRKWFDNKTNIFESIIEEHQFQTLTESNKPSNAFRTGIYISKVESSNSNPENLKFHLLRCSSNFSGPTDNIRKTDSIIVSNSNIFLKDYFYYPFELNHVQAQIYHNYNSELTDCEGFVETKSEKKQELNNIQIKQKIWTHMDLLYFVLFMKILLIIILLMGKIKKYPILKLTFLDFMLM